jgi:hypothetical protein
VTSLSGTDMTSQRGAGASRPETRGRQLVPMPTHDISSAVLEGLTGQSIPALCEGRDRKTTRGLDHGYYRGNLAVRAFNGAG